MSGPKWKRERDRTYYASTPGIQAFVFSAAKPMTLWAWYVVWSLESKRKVGSIAGVEHGFRSAQQKAEVAWLKVEAVRDKEQLS